MPGGPSAVGDPEGSGTREVLVESDDDSAKNVDTDQVLSAKKAKFFSPDCPFLGQIALDWATPLADGSGSLAGADLARCWGSLHDEPLPARFPARSPTKTTAANSRIPKVNSMGSSAFDTSSKKTGSTLATQVVVVLGLI